MPWKVQVGEFTRSFRYQTPDTSRWNSRSMLEEAKPIPMTVAAKLQKIDRYRTPMASSGKTIPIVVATKDHELFETA